MLFGTNTDVAATNESKLENSGSPVAQIEAKYGGFISPTEGAKVDADHCNGLEHLLEVSVGRRVFRTFEPKI
jgi:hypothetical protein